MLIKDNFVVTAPVEVVWAFFQDMPRVSMCMPGADSVEEVEPNKYRGKLKAKVGAIRASFSGEVVITDQVAPELLKASIKAEDRSLASLVTGTFTSQLTPVESGTQVDYEVDVALRGRLATVGFASVQQVARRMTTQFASCLQEALSSTS
jgi:carbon monoxide dehydrogenase subunit G